MRRLSITALALLGLLTASIDAQTVRYIYDEAGRLVGVIDPSGDAAAYNYDAVGNLLSITRSTSTQVTIIEFTPNAGPVGQTVTIHGTGFSAIPGQNTVTFNGTTASVSSASTTTLVVAVPTGATSGAIGITSPNGSASSGTSFAVVADLTPTITSTTPGQGAAGTSVTIAGTNYQTVASHNLVAFNAAPAPVSTASSTSLTTAVPPTATSGKVTVTTPFGTATSASDFIVPPPPFGTGDVAATYRMSPGNSQVVTIGTSGKVALVLFDASAGQRVSLHVSSGSGTTVRLYSYDGTQLGVTSAGGQAGFIDATLMPASASYTILVDPVGPATGSWTLTLYDVPADVTGTIPEDGTNHGITMSTPGQNARLTFTGSAGQRVSLKASSGPMGTYYLLSPDRSQLGPTTTISTVFATFVDTQTLPLTGTYTVVVDYGTTQTGSLTLNLYTVPADVTSSIATDGTAVTLTTTTPGQNGIATFTGTSGHRTSLWITGVSTGTTVVSLRDSDGDVVASLTVGSLGGFIEPATLAESGTHSIVVDPGGSGTGSVTLRLYDIAADITGSLTVNGGTTGVSITGPGQIASYTFAGTASQQVTVRVTNSDINLPTGSNTTVTVKLVRANGTVLTSSTTSVTTFNLAAQTLPATETYTVVIDPTSPGIGTLTIEVTNP